SRLKLRDLREGNDSAGQAGKTRQSGETWQSAGTAAGHPLEHLLQHLPLLLELLADHLGGVVVETARQPLHQLLDFGEAWKQWLLSLPVLLLVVLLRGVLLGRVLGLFLRGRFGVLLRVVGATEADSGREHRDRQQEDSGQQRPAPRAAVLHAK